MHPALIQHADFLLRGGRAGVLLVHGLAGTPADLRFVGKGLNRAGFTVYGLQLAGHGGSPADLVKTGWRDWMQSVREGAGRLRREVDHVFVAGLSMGAVLALRLAMERPQWVDGLGLYGSTFMLDGWSVPRSARRSLALPLLCGLGLFRQRAWTGSFPYGIKDERVRRQIVGTPQDGHPVAGFTTPWQALGEFHKLARKVRPHLADVRTPCLIMHAADDDIASVRNARLIERRVTGPTETVLLNDSYHLITEDCERDKVIARSADFFTRVLAAMPLRTAVPRSGAAIPAV
ncbi:MAG TPA: alpha/beta fold hydrolase [Rhodanobacteraceae bacterium]|nr:alpha/beta fold hydrolase [Rhodanobacteraceae bacterium]